MTTARKRLKPEEMEWNARTSFDMESFGHGSAAYEMLSVCIKAAPNGYCQGMFSDLYTELQAEAIRAFEQPNEQTAFVLKGLASRLIDGLCYGNWPGRPMP